MMRYLPLFISITVGVTAHFYFMFHKPQTLPTDRSPEHLPDWIQAVTAIAMVIIAVFNILLYQQSIRQDTLQYRPYIAFSKLSLSQVSPNEYDIIFNIRNYGQTPAQHVDWSFGSLMGGIEERIATTSDSRANAYIAPSQEYNVSGSLVSREDLELLRIGSGQFMVMRVDYQDNACNEYHFVVHLSLDSKGALYPYRLFEEKATKVC